MQNDILITNDMTFVEKLKARTLPELTEKEIEVLNSRKERQLFASVHKDTVRTDLICETYN